MHTWSKLEYNFDNCNKLANFLSQYLLEEHIVNFVGQSSLPIDSVREIAKEQFLQEYLEDEGDFISDCRNLDRSLLG